MNDQPSRFYAAPAQIDAFLREYFAEDVLLHFYRALGDEVLDEALMHGRRHRAAKEQSGNFKHVYLAGMADVMDEIWDNRYYPEKLPDMSSYTRPHKTPPQRPVPTVADWGRQKTAVQQMPEESLDALCQCGHPRKRHLEPPGAQCVACPGDSERSWRHEFTPEPAPAPETPQEAPCYRKKAHEPHDWLKGRHKAHCNGNPN